MTAYECKTLYNAPAGAGYQIRFSISKQFVSVLSRGGTFWVAPRAPGTTNGGAPIAQPTTTNGAVADGWIRIGAGESATFGDSSVVTPRRLGGSGFTTLYLDVWCEVQGDLVAISE